MSKAKPQPLRPDQIVRASPECRAAAEKGKTLNEEFVKLVIRSIYRTWDDVACDLQGERISYSGAIEICLDADRLWYPMQRYGAEAVIADEAVKVAIDTHGYTKVLRFLAKHIKLGV
jgi:hypothetical protein